MEIIAAIGGGSFVLTSLVTGCRLLWMSKRTRQLPEFILGLGLFLMGGLGYPLTMLGEFGTGLADGTRAALVMSNQLCGVVGLTLLGAFTWWVFRRDDKIAAALVSATGATFIALFVWRAMTHGFTPIALGGLQAPLLHTLLTIAVLGVSGAESLRYHMQLRKRMRLGLADPLITDRFRLWAVGMLVAMSLSGIASLCNYFDIAFNTTTIGILTTGVLGSVCAASIWCAFFPPRFYEGRVRARALSAQAAG